MNRKTPSLRRALGSPIWIILVVSFTSSCGRKPMSKDALLRYISKDNRLCQTKQFGDITVRAMYYPYQLLVEQELSGRGPAPTRAVVDSLERKYGGQVYFKLSFSKDHQEAIRQLGSFSRYSDMLQVLSFEMGKHLNMTTISNDTISVKDYAFQQDFGMWDANAVLVAFDKEKLKDSPELFLNIGEFGLDIGSLKFIFSQQDLSRAPRLKYAPLQL